jgi:hypothetical protein
MTRTRHDQDLGAALGELADLFPWGHLLASMNPTEFMRQAADEIKANRARIAELKDVILRDGKREG